MSAILEWIKSIRFRSLEETESTYGDELHVSEMDPQRVMDLAFLSGTTQEPNILDVQIYN